MLPFAVGAKCILFRVASSSALVAYLSVRMSASVVFVHVHTSVCFLIAALH